MSRARNVADIMSGAGSNVVFEDGFGLDFGSSVLDDYEEGTWTPVYETTGTNPSGTYLDQFGFYVKIGKFVHLLGRIKGGATSATGTGNLKIAGLPFTVQSNSANVGGGVVSFARDFALDHPIAIVPLESSTTASVVKKTSSDAQSSTEDISTSDLGTNSTSNLMIFSVSYITS